MIRLPRASLALAAVLSLLAAGLAAALPLPHVSVPHIGRSQPAGPLKLKPGEWPQAHSDVKADPEIRFGALPNGLRYAIKRQPTPPGQAAVRLWIDGGSLDETDAQQGLAHFLEHMAFKGSKAVPENDMIKILERHGLAFGADTNAETSFSETVYKLDLPKTDDETVDTALMLMRETASNLTLAQDAMDHERGVVLSEERTRDTPAYRVFKARFAFLMPGQRVIVRYPIGKTEVLRSAPVGQIADFYHRYYRPERMVLVAVGDFDPAAMEAKIRARFGDIKPVGPPGADPDLGRVQPRGAEAKVAVDPGAPLSLQVVWMRPPDLSADSVAKRRRELVRQLGFAVMNRRFQALARSPKPPFLGAAGFKFDEEHSAEMTMVAVNAEPDQWRPALEAADQGIRQAAAYGVRQDELDREIVELRALLKANVAGQATRRPAAIADQVVGSLSDPSVVTNPEQDLGFFEDAVKGLKAAEVSQALKEMFRGAGPLVFMASPKPVEGGDAALLAAFKAAEKTPVAAPGAPAQVSWPYESFGTPGKVADSKDVADLDTTFVRFENGVRLTVKPTKFSADQVLIRVNIGHGMADLAPDRQSLRWAGNAIIEGGLKKISNEDMERVLADKVFAARFGVADDAFVLSGQTRREDLPSEMQVLAAYASEPGWRPEAFARVKNEASTLEAQFEGTDSGVFSRDLQGLLHAGDRRWTFPSRQEIAGAELSDLQASVAPHLANDSIEVVVVGDVSLEQATEAVAATFGALPPRPSPTPVPESARRMGFPAGTAQPVVLTHKGRADQAIGYMAWPAADFWTNPQRARDDAVLGEVMGLRLVEQLRQAQGVTYAPSVSYAHSLTWKDWGYLAATVEVPPAKLDGFFGDVAKIAADLRAQGPTADELARAKTPRLEEIQKARVTNGYWLTELSGAQADPRKLDAIRQLIPGTERVSAEDVRRAAAALLEPGRAWKLEVRPAAAK